MILINNEQEAIDTYIDILNHENPVIIEGQEFAAAEILARCAQDVLINGFADWISGHQTNGTMPPEASEWRIRL